MSLKRIIVYLLLAFFAGMATENLFNRDALPKITGRAAAPVEKRIGRGDGMTDPLLMCDTSPDSPENAAIRSFKKIVTGAIKRETEAKWITSAGVYYRDLSNGRWFALGANEVFEPASLMKVPILISILRDADRNPDILKRRVRFNTPQDLTSLQKIKPPDLMKPGNFYSVDDLLFRMIAYSDNNATYLLEDIVNPLTREELFSDLNVESPYRYPDKTVYVSVDKYASFFRVLYNSSYLSEQMSEKAMKYLAASTFKEGLVAGVPTDVVVAHKFGERGDNQDHNKYLSDCGIVYFPRHPYLLCVMTKGPNFETLDDAVRDISATVFREVGSHYN